MNKPDVKPANPCFSSGPTSKRPGWRITNLPIDSLGRSHRAVGEKAKLREIIEQSKSILTMPEDYLLAIVPASDTGAFEMAMWSMLGERGVDILSWESFGQGWRTDIQKQLKLEDVRDIASDYGDLPDLASVDFSRDVIFTWNGTTSGVCVPDGKWIASDRSGLTFCDATSAVFAMELDWPKLDVVTWSWQKVLGGEAAHGMIALSPRAISRLESYTPPWPVPKIFRLTRAGKVMTEVFEGSTINTPSMLAVEDQLDALAWAANIGGLTALIARSQQNLAAISDAVDSSDWLAFLARDERLRSSTSICLTIKDSWFVQKSADEQNAIIKLIVKLLDDEGVAFDIGSYRDAPPGLRIWGGSTIESADVQKLMPWLDWAYRRVRS